MQEILIRAKAQEKNDHLESGTWNQIKKLHNQKQSCNSKQEILTREQDLKVEHGTKQRESLQESNDARQPKSQHDARS